MTDAELFTWWLVGLGIAAVVVLLAAALLVAILLTARSILGHAGQALEVAEQIAADTDVIWKLDETNRMAGELLEAAASIEQHGGHIARTVHGAAADERARVG